MREQASMGDTSESDEHTPDARPIFRVPLSGTPGQRETEGVDAEISGAIERGDLRRALSLCVQEHGPAIGRFCMAMVGVQTDADALTRETLLEVYRGFAKWTGDRTLRAWLFGVARRNCLRHLEKRRRRVGGLRLVGEEELAGPEDLAALRQKAERVRAALEATRPTEREALLLRYVAQLSFADVAAACGIEEAEARSRVSRAISSLHGRIAGELIAGDR